MNTKIFNINTINKTKWDKMAIQNSNICQTHGWALANRSIFNEPLFIVAEENGEWAGCWMIFYNSVRILPSLFSRAIHIPSEPVVIDETKTEIIVEKIWKEIELMRPICVTWLNYVNSRWEDKEFLEKKEFNEIVEYGSHILDLYKSEEELWKNMHGKHRNKVRKGEKTGIVIEESSDIKSYYQMSEATYKRSGGIGPSYRALEQAYKFLNPEGMCKLFFGRRGDKWVSGAFMLLCGGRVTYWHGATCDNPPTGSSNLLQWELMKKFKSEGYRWYDFGGASLGTEEKGKSRGINRFKERFGGDLEIFWGGNRIYSPLKKKVLDNVIHPFMNVPKYLYGLLQRYNC